MRFQEKISDKQTSNGCLFLLITLLFRSDLGSQASRTVNVQSSGLNPLMRDQEPQRRPPPAEALPGARGWDGCLPTNSGFSMERIKRKVLRT